MLRIALRVRLRLRSAQDDTEGSEAEDFKKNNPSVTLSRATSLCTKEAESCVCFKSKKLYFEICRYLVGFLREEAGAVRD